ncbi:hypothetical protein Hanom_Chr01g00067021 [Helianthus anomalus]
MLCFALSLFTHLHAKMQARPRPKITKNQKVNHHTIPMSLQLQYTPTTSAIKHHTLDTLVNDREWLHVRNPLSCCTPPT